MEKIKAAAIAGFTALSAWMGVLAVPVYLLVLTNLIDYATGIAASVCRKEAVSSYRGIHGIIKKVCMWLLVAVGAIIDILAAYAAEQAGISLPFGYAAASLAAVWLVCNELLSVLENIAQTGVQLPPFLEKMVSYLKTQAEDLPTGGGQK
ncbi:phage holin family protein [Faecalispora anaeroviscerum]|uniref:phage holin family protein n=1 Tax=Faecalispora anaeroviscerum TaxID=2991836 RepID=UPI0024BAA4E7|nr:phage holin family protein [Faecalispora anaeroviscerum]